MNMRRLGSGFLLCLAVSLWPAAASPDLFLPGRCLRQHWASVTAFEKAGKEDMARNAEGKSMPHHRVIFSTEETAKVAHIVHAEAPFWMPALEQVQELESLLPTYLKRHPPRDDKPVGNIFFACGRQYFGVTRGGQKLIYLNAFCNPERFDRRWEKEIILVQDGGSCYFQVYFSPASSEFMHLHYNGQA